MKDASRPPFPVRGLLGGLLMLLAATPLLADVSVPAIFGSHMVLQRNQANPVWGRANPGEGVTVQLGDQRHTTTADAEGHWRVALEPLPAGGPHQLVIEGENRLVLEDVLVGEVWICSGQSNMQWAVDQANDPDLEKLTARFPQMRIISVPRVGTQEPQYDFDGQWQAVTPESIGDFSAVGYFFGRQLHQSLDVPVGLIDNAWGGSAVEAWIDRDRLRADPQFEPLLARWRETEATFDYEAQMEAYRERLAEWRTKASAAEAEGRPAQGRPRAPNNVLVGQHRPANLYNGVLKPVLGYGIRGAIWYQGENNASRAYQYRELFPLMIQNWRDDWGQGEFPFYWVQLADFRGETEQPADSDWAELREAQTMTLDRLPNTGQAVIVDLGEASDIHPKNKQDVAKRLARLALAETYGLEVIARSPRFASLEQADGKLLVHFQEVGPGLDTFDVRQPLGFTVAGEDRQFHHAQARIVDSDTIEVSSEAVAEPIAVRYAWADNPVANVQNRAGLPLTPFRSDDWPGVTVDNQ